MTHQQTCRQSAAEVAVAQPSSLVRLACQCGTERKPTSSTSFSPRRMARDSRRPRLSGLRHSGRTDGRCSRSHLVCLNAASCTTMQATSQALSALHAQQPALSTSRPLQQQQACLSKGQRAMRFVPGVARSSGSSTARSAGPPRSQPAGMSPTKPVQGQLAASSSCRNACTRQASKLCITYACPTPVHLHMCAPAIVR